MSVYIDYDQGRLCHESNRGGGEFRRLYFAGEQGGDDQVQPLHYYYHQKSVPVNIAQPQPYFIFQFFIGIFDIQMRRPAPEINEQGHYAESETEIRPESLRAGIYPHQ